MEFTDEQLEDIEKLASLNYTIRQIALYLDIPEKDLWKAYQNPNYSPVKYHFDRGKLHSQAKIDMKRVQKAEAGDINSGQIVDKVREAKHFENIRDQIIYGSE